MGVTTLNSSDIFCWRDLTSKGNIAKERRKGTLPKLSKVCKIIFRRGSFQPKVCLGFATEEISFNIFKENGNYSRTIKPYTNKNTSGISVEKKNDIIKKLLPLMPQNRREFWLNL